MKQTEMKYRYCQIHLKSLPVPILAENIPVPTYLIKKIVWAGLWIRIRMEHHSISILIPGEKTKNARKLVVIVILLNKFGPAPSFLLFSNLIRLFQLQKNVQGNLLQVFVNCKI